MLLIPNGARARDQPSRNVSFQSISRLITLDLAHYQPAMAVCNIRQLAAGSVVPFPKTLHGVGYQENQYSWECLLVVSKHATGLYMGLGVHIKKKITIPCPPRCLLTFA